MRLFCVGRFALAVFCLQIPQVGNIGTISKTLKGIGLPIVPFLPMVRSPNTRFVSSHERINLTNHLGVIYYHNDPSILICCQNLHDVGRI